MWGGNHRRGVPARSLGRRLAASSLTSKSIGREESGLTILALTLREGRAVNKSKGGQWLATDQLVFCFVSFHKVESEKKGLAFSCFDWLFCHVLPLLVANFKGVRLVWPGKINWTRLFGDLEEHIGDAFSVLRASLFFPVKKNPRTGYSVKARGPAQKIFSPYLVRLWVTPKLFLTQNRVLS